MWSQATQALHGISDFTSSKLFLPKHDEKGCGLVKHGANGTVSSINPAFFQKIISW
ncbi:hypothetical protein SACS_1123 [Parasaccharibacter apium]|uniref:Uncharacterized protein n=1 Tax=Parasaccharibacter apium TaxID=1510841 RepID=A0A7U7J160_9PROT|nr:hypothetical protein SACS_1123 [Parasaccharibacter apium]